MSKSNFLKNVSLFAGLNDEQLKKIITNGEKKTASDGEVIFKEGDPGDAVYVILEGRVQIEVKLSRESEQAPVHTILPGKIFGEFSLVADHKRSATAHALKDTVYFKFTRETFHALADEDPTLGYILLRKLSEILVGRIVKTTRELRSSLMF